MSELKHTKGNWHAKDGQVYPEETGVTIAHVYPGENQEADSKVIAAAPDLLAACEEWLEIWLYIREKYPDIEIPFSLRGSSDACGRLRSAIEKAKYS